MPITRSKHRNKPRPLLTLCLALAALLFLPDIAPALQVHDVPGEGLRVHQMGHIYYFVALLFFFAYIRRSDFNERSWRYLQAFCILMAAWNLLSCFGHIAARYVTPESLVERPLNIHDRLLPPLTFAKWLYYVARLDNLISVPALFFLYMALRTFYRQVLDDMAAEAAAKKADDAIPGEERP